MKPKFLFIIAFFATLDINAQYYLRGTVNNESGSGIPNVKIFLSSKGTFPFSTGSSGAFGIPLSVLTDTIVLKADGFETIKAVVETRRYQVITMKLTSASRRSNQHKLVSRIPFNDDAEKTNYYDGESYTNLIENGFTSASRYPSTGFALNINRASYSNIRRFINMNMEVPSDAVRIEEMLNYFNFSQNNSRSIGDFTCSSRLTSTPWNATNQLFFINIKAPVINVEKIPPTNLVFLIDVSGSMDQPNRLPLLKDAFKMLVNNLRAQDTVSIVIYGGIVGIYLPPTSGTFKDSIKNAIDQLEAGGETPGEAAIKTAYSLAERIFNKNANNRIILATDGDFNVGQTTDEELEDIVITHRQSGIYLTCLGVGMGNYKDSKLETLAKKGNGNFAYIDNIYEAEKVLVTEFTKTLYTVANDAYVNIRFNPACVNEYRLIGFDNKKDVIEDSTSELEGAEVGTGHSFTAVFEIKPVTSVNGNIADCTSIAANTIAAITLHYKIPGADSSVEMPFTLQNNFTRLADADSSLKVAASVIMFGGLLKHSELWTNYTWDDIIALAKTSVNPASFIETELLTLLEKAKKIYATDKKRKGKEPEK